jgi:hypothetical protein
MKDQRVAFFRKLLDSLVESLEATVRIARWHGEEAIPEPLQQSATKLLDRLGTANRLAADKYAGPPPVVACMAAMSSATQRLDFAYVEYRKHIDGKPEKREEAASALDAEVDIVKAESHRWS